MWIHQWLSRHFDRQFADSEEDSLETQKNFLDPKSYSLDTLINYFISLH